MSTGPAGARILDLPHNRILRSNRLYRWLDLHFLLLLQVLFIKGEDANRSRTVSIGWHPSGSRQDFVSSSVLPSSMKTWLGHQWDYNNGSFTQWDDAGPLRTLQTNRRGHGQKLRCYAIKPRRLLLERRAVFRGKIICLRKGTESLWSSDYTGTFI